MGIRVLLAKNLLLVVTPIGKSFAGTFKLMSDRRETPDPVCPTDTGSGLDFVALLPESSVEVQTDEDEGLREMKASIGPATLTFDPAPIGIYH